MLENKSAISRLIGVTLLVLLTAYMVRRVYTDMAFYDQVLGTGQSSTLLLAVLTLVAAGLLIYGLLRDNRYVLLGAIVFTAWTCIRFMFMYHASGDLFSTLLVPGSVLATCVLVTWVCFGTPVIWALLTTSFGRRRLPPSTEARQSRGHDASMMG